MRAINKSSKGSRRVSRRARGIELYNACVSWNKRAYYIGPKFIGDYGRITIDEPMNIKRYLYGVASFTRFIDNGFVIVDEVSGAKRLTDNVYENGNGNIVFIDELDSNMYSYYFNIKDSKIIRKWFATGGKKYIGCKEDLFEVIGEYYLKKLFDSKLRDNDITIDNKPHKFRSYNEFYKELRKHIFSGYSASFDIICDEKYYNVTFHSVSGWNYPEVEM